MYCSFHTPSSSEMMRKAESPLVGRGPPRRISCSERERPMHRMWPPSLCVGRVCPFVLSFFCATRVRVSVSRRRVVFCLLSVVVVSSRVCIVRGSGGGAPRVCVCHHCAYAMFSRSAEVLFVGASCPEALLLVVALRTTRECLDFFVYCNT